MMRSLKVAGMESMVNGLLCVRKLVGISVIISAFLACILCPVTFSSHTRIQ